MGELVGCVCVSDVIEGGCEIYRCDGVFFFQAEDGIRVAQESRGLGDVYKRQLRVRRRVNAIDPAIPPHRVKLAAQLARPRIVHRPCLLYTSDAADDLLCVDLGGRRIIKKKRTTTTISALP